MPFPYPHPHDHAHIQPHLLFPAPSELTRLTFGYPNHHTLSSEYETHAHAHAHVQDHAQDQIQIQEILESVSRLASGSGTPTLPNGNGNGSRVGVEEGGGGGGAISAEELVARLASGGTDPLLSLAPSLHRVPLREWTAGQPMALIALSGQRGGVIPFHRLAAPPGPINLDLYDLQCHAVPSGYLLRFTLLEWDEVRLDRLIVSLKRRLKQGAHAHVCRTLLHDAFWSWRLQMTIYLGSSSSSFSSHQFNPEVILVTRHRMPAGLIAPL